MCFNLCRKLCRKRFVDDNKLMFLGVDAAQAVRIGQLLRQLQTDRVGARHVN